MNSEELLKLFRQARRDVDIRNENVPYWDVMNDSLLREADLDNKEQYYRRLKIETNPQNDYERKLKEQYARGDKWQRGLKRHLDAIGKHEPITYVDIAKHKPKFTLEDEMYVIHSEQRNDWPTKLGLVDADTLPRTTRSLFTFMDWYIDETSVNPIPISREIPKRPGKPEPSHELFNRCVAFMLEIRYKKSVEVDTIKKFYDVFTNDAASIILSNFDLEERLQLELELYLSDLNDLLKDIQYKIQRDASIEMNWNARRNEIEEDNKRRDASILNSINKRIELKRKVYEYFKSIKKPCPCGCDSKKPELEEKKPPPPILKEPEPPKSPQIEVKPPPKKPKPNPPQPPEPPKVFGPRNAIVVVQYTNGSMGIETMKTTTAIVGGNLVIQPAVARADIQTMELILYLELEDNKENQNLVKYHDYLIWRLRKKLIESDATTPSDFTKIQIGYFKSNKESGVCKIGELNRRFDKDLTSMIALPPAENQTESAISKNDARASYESIDELVKNGFNLTWEKKSREYGGVDEWIYLEDGRIKAGHIYFPAPTKTPLIPMTNNTMKFKLYSIWRLTALLNEYKDAFLTTKTKLLSNTGGDIVQEEPIGELMDKMKNGDVQINLPDSYVYLGKFEFIVELNSLFEKNQAENAGQAKWKDQYRFECFNALYQVKLANKADPNKVNLISLDMFLVKNQLKQLGIIGDGSCLYNVLALYLNNKEIKPSGVYVKNADNMAMKVFTRKKRDGRQVQEAGYNSTILREMFYEIFFKTEHDTEESRTLICRIITRELMNHEYPITMDNPLTWDQYTSAMTSSGQNEIHGITTAYIARNSKPNEWGDEDTIRIFNLFFPDVVITMHNDAGVVIQKKDSDGNIVKSGGNPITLYTLYRPSISIFSANENTPAEILERDNTFRGDYRKTSLILIYTGHSHYDAAIPTDIVVDETFYAKEE